MADNWGKLILGALAGAAIWKAIGPNGQQQVIDALDIWAAEFDRKKQEEERQKRLALIDQSIGSMPKQPQTALPALATLDEPKLATPVEPDARWREVIVPPAVIRVLGKRGSGKSALAYRMLELFRNRLTPYLVGAPAQAGKLLPEWVGTAQIWKTCHPIQSPWWMRPTSTSTPGPPWPKKALTCPNCLTCPANATRH